MKQLDYKKVKCDLCYGSGFLPIVVINEWHEEYNTLAECPICEVKGELRILNTKE